MSAGFLLAYIYLKRREQHRSKLQKRQLRDASNPMCIPEKAFIQLYHINKAGFLMILKEIAPLINRSKVPENLQLAAALRFLAVGKFKGVLVNDVNISLGRSTLTKVLWNVMQAIEKKLCRKWIQLKMSEEEAMASKMHFYQNYEIPSVIGCIDGTHVRIKKPSTDEYLFYNPEGFFSINVMIICDYKMRIRAVDASKHGSSEDWFVWGLSEIKRYFEIKLQNGNGERNGWLLGDSEYEIEPYLLTPYKNPDYNTNEYHFNVQLYSALNTIEKTIKDLQKRLRCLQTTTLPYSPLDAVRTINVCSALHNICKHYNIEIKDTMNSDFVEEIYGNEFLSDDDDEVDDENDDSDVEGDDEPSPDNDGKHIRDEITEGFLSLRSPDEIDNEDIDFDDDSDFDEL